MGTFPGSLSEGAGSPTGLTEGVSSDGCSGPTIYEPAHINSEIFERLRSSGYTPSVSLSLDSSLREGAGIWCVPFNVSPGSREVAGDFHRPYESSETVSFYHSSGDTPSGREPGWGACHSTCRSETARLGAIFIAPTEREGGYTGRFGHKNKKSRAKTSSKRQKNQLTNAAL